jgi:glycine oxidase
MVESAEVAIVGGGVIGLTTAWFLAEQGVRVVLLDRGELGREASWAGAGIIPPGNPYTARTPLDRLRAVSADLYPSLSRALRDRTGIDNGYRRCGGLELPEPGETPPIAAWQAEELEFTELTGAALRELTPELSDTIDRGFHFPNLAQIRNPWHLRALTLACQSSGVRLRPATPVTAVEVQGGRVVGVRLGSERLAAEQVLLAAGAWTDALLTPLGFRPGVKPIRGQIVLFNTGRAEPPFVILRGKNYLVRRGDGRVLVGSTEEDVGFDPHTTDDGIASLVQFAQGLLPSLAEATIERTWAGLRPGSPDGLPFLGAVPGIAGLWIAAGHFRAGLQLSPATALEMTRMLRGEPTVIPLDEFCLTRSPTLIGRSLFRS